MFNEIGKLGIEFLIYKTWFIEKIKNVWISSFWL
jgi:hypothetical protein